MSNEVDLGLRIFLNDMLSSGLNALRGGMSSLVNEINGSKAAAAGFASEMMSTAAASNAAYEKSVDLTWAIGQGEKALKSMAAEEAALGVETEDLVSRQVQIIEEISNLGTATANYTSMTQAQKDELKQLSNEYASNNTLLKQYEAETQQLNKTIDDQVTGLEALKAERVAVTQVETDAIAANGKAGQALADEVAQTQALTSAFTGLGVALGSGIDLMGFAAGLGYSVKASASLQDSLVGVKITLNATDAEMQIMGQTITSVAGNSIFSSAQVADAFAMLGDKGFKADAILQGMGKTAIDLAEAIKSDAAPAADLLASTMQVFGAKASDAKQYADALSFAFHNGMPSVSDLNVAMNNLGASAQQAGIPIGELMPVMDFLTQHAMTASSAGSSLKYMLTSLQSPTAAAMKEMGNLGLITMNSVTPAFEAFNQKLDAVDKTQHRASPTFNGTLSSLLDIYNAAQKTGTLSTDQTFLEWAQKLGMLNDKLYNSNGTFKDFFDILKLIGDQLKGLDPQHLNDAMNTLFNSKGGQAPKLIFKDFPTAMGQIQDLVTKFQQFSGEGGVAQAATDRSSTLNGEMKKLSTTIQTFAANIGSAFTGPLGTAVGWINSLISSMSGSQVSSFGQAFLSIGAGLSAVGVIGGLVWAGVALAGSALAGPFMAVAGTVVGVSAGVAAGIVVLAAVGGAIVANWKQLEPIFKNIIGPLAAVGVSVGLLGTAAWGAVSAVSGLTAAINTGKAAALLSTAATWAATGATNAWNLALTILGIGTARATAAAGGNTIAIYANNISKWLSVAATNTLAVAKNFLNGTYLTATIRVINNTVATIVSSVVKAFNATVSWIQAAAKTALSAVMTLLTAKFWASVAATIAHTAHMIAGTIATWARSAATAVLTALKSLFTAALWRAVGAFIAHTAQTIAGTIASWARVAVTIVLNVATYALATATFLLGIALNGTFWLIILGIALFAGMAVGLYLLIQHFGGLNTLVKIGQAIWGELVKVFSDIGNQIKATVMDAIKQLQPTWNQLVQAFNQAKPALMAMGVVLGVIAAVIVGVLIGAFRGLLGIVVPVIQLIVGVISGFIKVVMGIAQVFMSVFTIIHGIFTGNSAEIQAGFKGLAQGIVNIFSGLWGMVSSIFVGAFNIIKGFITGFISGIVGFFTHLYDTLVGHSIIPDTVKGIVSWIASLPGQAITHIQALVSGIVNAATSLWGKFKSGVLEPFGNNIKNFFQGAVSWGENMMKMFAQGIQNGIGWVTTQINNVINGIKNKLGFHSPPKEGVLSDSDQYMPNMMKMFGVGIDSNMHHVTGAVGRVANALAPGSLTHPNGLAFSPGGAFGGASGGTTVLPVNIDGKAFMQIVLDHSTNTLKMNGMGRSLK